MSDPLLDEARKAVRGYHLQSVRVNAATAARLHGAPDGEASPGEMEVREAIRALMMALPLLPVGTPGLVASGLSPLVRAVSLMQRLRGAPAREGAAQVSPTELYYIEKD